jgi:hypothetical protein
MSFADGQFSSAIRDTLAEPAVNMVNFRAGGLMIGTMHLKLISALITNGTIKCKIDATKVTNGAAAVYDLGDKTIYGIRADAFYADEKSTFVHECTHAFIHLMGWARVMPSPFRVKVLKNEAAAYLAGGMYVVANGQQLSTSSAAPSVVGYKVAKTKGLGAGPTNAGSPVVFEDADLAPLHNAIRGSPLYRNWNSDETMN